MQNGFPIKLLTISALTSSLVLTGCQQKNNSQDHNANKSSIVKHTHEKSLKKKTDSKEAQKSDYKSIKDSHQINTRSLQRHSRDASLFTEKENHFVDEKGNSHIINDVKVATSSTKVQTKETDDDKSDIIEAPVIIPETKVPDTAPSVELPESDFVPETKVPDTAPSYELPESDFIPETKVPDTAPSYELPESDFIPETKVPDTAPSVELPESDFVPETKVPDTSPSVELPESDFVPETKVPDTAPSVELPESDFVPETKVPDTAPSYELPEAKVEVAAIPGNFPSYELPESDFVPETKVPDTAPSYELPEAKVEVVAIPGNFPSYELPESDFVPETKIPDTAPSYELPESDFVPETKVPTNNIPKVVLNEIQTNTITERSNEVAFEIETIEDDTLNKGNNIVEREGQNGYTETVSTQFISGEQVIATTVESTRVIEPINRIVRVGTRVDEAPEETDTPNTHLYSGAAIGDKHGFNDEYEITRIPDELKALDYTELDKLSDEEKFEKYEKYETDKDRTYSLVGKDTNNHYWYLPYNHSDEFIHDFNYTDKVIDLEKLNSYFLEYLNAERASLGLNSLTYDAEKIQIPTSKRAIELAEFGSMRPSGKKHVRPNGDHWSTVLAELYPGYNTPQRTATQFGENLLYAGIKANPYYVVSEKAIAKMLFEQWKDSPHHYENMINPNFTKNAVDIKIIKNKNTIGMSGADVGYDYFLGAELLSN